MNEIKALRERLGERWRRDPVKRSAEESRIKLLRACDPVHFDRYNHLWGAQWFKGGAVSKAELAGEIGVSVRSIERWEAGDSKPIPIAAKAMEALEK